MSAQQFQLLDERGESAGHCTLETLNIDGFGTPHTTENVFASIDVRRPPRHSPELAAKIAGASEVYLRSASPDMCEHFAAAAGRALDAYWPMFEAMRGRQIAQARLAPLAAEYQPTYLQALEATEPEPELSAQIESLNAAILGIVEEVAWSADFARRWGVLRVMNAGSTSRGTYLGKLVDFDPVVETAIPAGQLDPQEIQSAAESIARRIEHHAAFAAYLRLIGLAPSSLKLASAGIRGKESFVARFEIEAGGASHNLLDITFGRLPQLTGYEIWFQRFLNGLAPGARTRLRREIRLAKKIIRANPGLYGSAQGGFRAHLIEQWIIQSANYRAGGFTLDNALRLLAEEAAEFADGKISLRRDFAEYKTAFPVWHPGWWETETGLSPAGAGVNLFDLLGNGDAVSAGKTKWPIFAALGPAHVSLIEQDGWAVQALVDATQAAA